MLVKGIFSFKLYGEEVSTIYHKYIYTFEYINDTVTYL